MIRFLSVMLSMGIVMAFGTVGILSIEQSRRVIDFHFFGVLLLFVVPLAWLVTLALTNRE
jgi:hypothetical protein